MANQMNTHTQIERLFKLISESHDFQLNLDYIPGTPVLEFFFFYLDTCNSYIGLWYWQVHTKIFNLKF